MVFLHRFFNFRRGVIFIMFGQNLFGLYMISLVQFALNNNTLPFAEQIRQNTL